ncbi:biotin/lipoyl-binding protein [Pirellulales bacterium]|nr:biotin/lipoyl-binding protein [Pirellulales bacterium]
MTIDGKVHEVEVEIIDDDRAHVGRAAPTAPLPAAAPVAVGGSAPAAAASMGAAPADESKSFRSPISGVVVKVPLQVGQSIKAGDTLMVLEAMKMETVLTAAADGKVAQVHAGVGDAVQVKQLLVEFE